MQPTEEVAATENVLEFFPCDTTGVVLLEGTEKELRAGLRLRSSQGCGDAA